MGGWYLTTTERMQQTLRSEFSSGRMKIAFLCAFPYFSRLIYLFSNFYNSMSNFYKLVRCLQWGTHKHLAGGKMPKNKLIALLLMLSQVRSYFHFYIMVSDIPRCARC
jgi:hypothetical protein